MKWVIDRIEEDKAVLINDTGKTAVVSVDFLEGLKEGDAFEMTPVSTEDTKNELSDRLNRLFKREK